MNIEITPVKKYEVKINGRSIGEFKHESSWEGLVKLSSDEGVIIANEPEFTISKIFGEIFAADKETLKVVKISPMLVPTTCDTCEGPLPKDFIHSELGNFCTIDCEEKRVSQGA